VWVPRKVLVLGFVVSGSLCAAQGVAFAQMHGYVDPCQVSFQEDNQTECQLCEPSAHDPKRCEKQLASGGYVFKCRTTPGHSKPGEVWCAPKNYASQNIRRWGVAAIAVAALGVIFVFTRRGRSRAKQSRRAR
jgi:hypothetical protein